MEPTTHQPEEPTIFPEEEFSMEGYDKHIRNARIILYALAGLTFLSIYTLVPFDDNPMRIVLAVAIAVFGIVFVVLALWTKKKPYYAILTALIVFVTMEGLAAVIDPISLWQGWLIKIAVIVLLLLGLRNAKESQDTMTTFGKKK
jgi:hypothetical protein